jgi:hypothetical protein
MDLDSPRGISQGELDAFVMRVEEHRKLLERAHRVAIEALWVTPPVPGKRQTRVVVRFQAKES